MRTPACSHILPGPGGCAAPDGSLRHLTDILSRLVLKRCAEMCSRSARPFVSVSVSVWVASLTLARGCVYPSVGRGAQVNWGRWTI